MSVTYQQTQFPSELALDSASDYITLSRNGLSFKQLKSILKYCGLSIKKYATVSSISERQLLRYTDKHMLNKTVSAQLIQIARLYQLGYSVFENEINFQKWMDSEIRSLNFRKPYSLLDTPFGINEIKSTLGRLEHGVYS